jgi:hypothetical protein
MIAAGLVASSGRGGQDGGWGDDGGDLDGGQADDDGAIAPGLALLQFVFQLDFGMDFVQN